MARKTIELSLFDPAIVRRAAADSFRKLAPRALARNPVMFVVGVGAALTTLIFLRDLASGGDAGFSGQIAGWLWFTVLFANFAEAIAEGRGRARADTFRATRRDAPAKRFADEALTRTQPAQSGELKAGDVVLVEAGDLVPADGEVIEGIASVNESAITGESAPVIREAGGDRSAVTGGTTVVSDWIKVRVTQRAGESFLDRMIAMVEGATRQKTPNEIALNILLVGMTIIFLIVVATLQGFAAYSGALVSVTALIALLVTLIPTTIGGLLSAIGIAGMDRLMKANVVAKSGRAIEAAGDVDTLLLDKTGTITFGNRMASEFIALRGVTERDLAEAAYLASLSDETPEGRSIVELAQRRFGFEAASLPRVASFIPFSAHTRMSGADLDRGQVRKGAVDSVLARIGALEAGLASELNQAAQRISMAGGTPLAVARDGRALGLVHLKDIVKPDIRERFAELRSMGIRTVMITGDNPLTAATIAAEAGVDDFLAEASPERKLELIRREQAEGKLVAMCGDGSNDAPALAQSDVGLAMNNGTPAAREAANLIDLDSDPTKLLEVVRVGKQLLISRGSLTTFSLDNDVAKYFAILPALFVGVYPQMEALNVMRLASPESAILSAIIFNALIIVALIPLALKGVAFRVASAVELLRRNLLIYGLGGVALPFVGIKAIDLIVSMLGLA